MNKEELFDFIPAFAFLILSVCQVLHLKSWLYMACIAIIFFNLLRIFCVKSSSDKVSKHPLIRGCYWLSVILLLTDLAKNYLI